MISTIVVSAGETFKLDFEKSPNYVIGVNEGDRVEFEMNNSLHTILIKGISLNRVDLATFTYVDLESSKLRTPYYSAITDKKFMKLDIDRDNKEDLYVIYEKSNNTAAQVRFQLPLPKDKDLEIFPENQFKQTNYLLYLLIALGVILVLYFASKQLKKKSSENKQTHSDPNKALHNK